MEGVLRRPSMHYSVMMGGIASNHSQNASGCWCATFLIFEYKYPSLAKILLYRFSVDGASCSKEFPSPSQYWAGSETSHRMAAIVRSRPPAFLSAQTIPR